jgi:hypothetical protein
VHRLPLSPPALELLDRLRKGRDASPLGCSLARSRASRCGKLWEGATVRLWALCDDVVVRKLVAEFDRALEREPKSKNAAPKPRGREITLSPPVPTGMSDVRIYDLRHSFCEWRGRRRIEPADHRACVSFP